MYKTGYVIYVYMHVCMYIYIYMHIYMYVCIYINICMYTFIYIFIGMMSKQPHKIDIGAVYSAPAKVSYILFKYLFRYTY